MLPQLAFEVALAKLFGIVTLAESVNYELVSRAYVAECAVLIRTAQWVKTTRKSLATKRCGGLTNSKETGIA